MSESKRPRREPRPQRHPPEGAPHATVAPGQGPERTLRIAGLPAVEALFRRHPERVLRLFYEDRMVPKVGDFCRHLAELRRPYRLLEAEELARVAGTVLHGGIVAVTEAPTIPFLDWTAVRAFAAAGQPLVVLDGVGNPHNLGAIARTLAFLGFRHLLISDHPAQAGLSDAAYRVAEGGLEYLTVHRATQLPEVLRRLSGLYRVVGTALGKGLAPEALGPDARPVALVLGNEEHGLSAETLRACESVVTLRGAGPVQSLNVSASTAILAYLLRPAGSPPGGQGPRRGAKPRTGGGREPGRR